MIEPGYFWNNVILLAIGTLVIRGSLIALSAKLRISERARELFSFIPAAVLPAFVAPAVYFHQGQVEALMGKERFVILALATALCYVTRSTLATIAFGLAALYLITSNFA
ncbi:MAG TPA: AzlD domain-containing protein [Bdellovibrionales bacterium]|nr:AzlD domain-containing protein [Bdellovibrionales bacterium]